MDKVQKAVLASIKPRWWEKIAIHRKTDEIRKNAPNLQPPFKCYIYQTQGMWCFPILRALRLFDLVEKFEMGKGKVVGEFVCDKVEQIDANNITRIEGTSMVSVDDMWKYARPKSMFDLKAWHISDLKVYDQPKPLNIFKQCHKCSYMGACNDRCWNPMQRPPQSWCYVEEV